MAAFEQSCRRCGHVLTARFDPELPLTSADAQHPPSLSSVIVLGGHSRFFGQRDYTQLS
jgi:hypothetical protein